MIRSATLLLRVAFVPLVSLGACTEPTQWRGLGRLDASRAFYYPRFGKETERELGTVAGRSIDAATYFRYLAGRFGTKYVEELAFDIALERECKARGLARSAPVLARSTAAMRFKESGRGRSQDPDHTNQRKFANESLRKLRVDAIIAAERSADKEALKILFDRRYGVDGQRVLVRQILVSYAGTRRRMGQPAGEQMVIAHARKRALELRQRITDSASFTELLRETDDRQAKRMLRSAQHKANAGVLSGYNYVRYGESFAKAVRALQVGAVSQPVQTETGFHLIELMERKITRLEDVATELRAFLARGPAKPVEVAALRRRLLEKYGFRRAK